MDVFDKLTLLTDSAKYDVACTSSGVDRAGAKNSIGNARAYGICHSFSSDGRCISLLKTLFTNQCIFDCKYCVNRASNDIERTSFTPQELADITINFYKRNYIEGLFLSSGILKNQDYTCEQMIKTLSLLRNEYNFRGYIHVKAIPGASAGLLHKLGLLADRMSVNIEMPSEKSLKLLAPNKTKDSILKPMDFIKNNILQNKNEIIKYNHANRFVPAGQSTQMIIGATPDTDYKIITLAQGLYNKYNLKRVFYSAYLPVMENSLLPSLDTKPPLLREHRLYQADWLLRYYGFNAHELLSNANPNFNLYIDPKCNWAVNHLELFPMEINTASYAELLRIPGIGVTSAKRIIHSRVVGNIDFEGLKKIGVVLKRAQYFITCKGKMANGIFINPHAILDGLMFDKTMLPPSSPEQLSLFDDNISKEDVINCLASRI